MTQQPEKQLHNIKCRRGSDRVTSGQSCDGLMAEKLSSDGQHTPTFRCSKCKYVWSVPIGGSFSIKTS
jgi:hypothetical protein